MGDGKTRTVRETVQREIRKQIPLAISVAVKLSGIGLYTLFTKSTFAQNHPIMTKTITGIMASLIIYWVVRYIKRRVTQYRTMKKAPSSE